MLPEYHQLVQEITTLTGATPPELLAEDAPVLATSALENGEASAPYYLVGLIGGKDVGKSSFVNALVGQEITARTSHGPGTEIVIAYAHFSVADAVKQLLDREVPNQHRIVPHELPHLRRQVLLDLPDIDSHYASHVEVTRRMLRHMLFPIWLQSIEKYADQRPRELLAQVAAGNDPSNFVFVLNKADQIVRREGEQAAQELRDDYARRLQKQLGLAQPPRVYLLSALHPELYDLPPLRSALSQERSEESVELSRENATRRQGMSLARWVEGQGLDQRLAALDRLQASTEEEVTSRVAGPVMETVLPRLLDDPAYRLSLSDELMRDRVKRWPIVNVMHVLLSPVVTVFRARLPIEQQRALLGPEELVETHLRSLAALRPSTRSDATPLAALVQSTFAFLQQSSPLVSRIYADRKLWEAMPAESAAGELRRRLSSTVERQRETLRARLSPGGFFTPMRVLLTVGALLWFPFVQPLLAAWLSDTAMEDLLVLAVNLLGVTFLLKSLTFLAVYFLLLWLLLKWDTQRRIDRHLERWKSSSTLDPTVSLPGQVLEWTSDLLQPLRHTQQRFADLVSRSRELREDVRALPAA